VKLIAKIKKMLRQNMFNLKYSFKFLYKILFLKYRLFFNMLFFCKNVFPKWLVSIVVNNYVCELHINSIYNVSVLFFLKNYSLFSFKSLVDLIVVDTPKNTDRFELIYNLLSYNYNVRLNIVVSLKELTPLYSITGLYSSATWLEREVWDLFGIFFFNNNDLRRILTDYGFRGHPLRKDFPLTGYFEIYYDDVKKSITRVPVSLAQEYRNFYFKTSWRR
jgi:NADH:ubiquinone oxidoreductase subunit C